MRDWLKRVKIKFWQRVCIGPVAGLLWQPLLQRSAMNPRKRSGSRWFHFPLESHQWMINEIPLSLCWSHLLRCLGLYFPYLLFLTEDDLDLFICLLNKPETSGCIGGRGGWGIPCHCSCHSQHPYPKKLDNRSVVLPAPRGFSSEVSLQITRVFLEIWA